MSAPPNSPQNSGAGSGPRWRRIALWSLAATLVFAAVAVIGVAVLLHSQRFHNYLLTRVRQSASQSLGVPVELQNFDLHWDGISPTTDLYGVVVHGAAPFANVPLVQVLHARIGLRVGSVLRRKWYLGEIAVDHPVVQLRVDQAGNSNLPAAQGTSNNGVQPLFDLAIRHLLINDGEIYYNDRRVNIQAELHALAINAGFVAAHKAYGGEISYSDGRFDGGGYRTPASALRAQFEITPVHLEVPKAELRTGKSIVAISGTLDDFTNPHVSVVYHASVDGAELRQALRIVPSTALLPLGAIQLDGHGTYAAKPYHQSFSALTLEGTVRSAQLDFALPAGTTATARTIPVQMRAVRISYGLAGGGLELPAINASLLNGSLEGRLSIRNLIDDQVGSAHCKLEAVSMAALQHSLLPGSSNNVALGGTAKAIADGQWRGSIESLLATADVTVDAAAQAPAAGSVALPDRAPAAGAAALPTLPISGELHASYRNKDSQLTLRQSYLRTPQSTLTLDGTVAQNSPQHSQMKLVLNAADLHEAESVVAIFRPQAPPLGLFGSATFTGALSGSVVAPRLSGQLNAANLRLHGSAWKLLRAHLDASANAVEIEGGELDPQPAAKGYAAQNANQTANQTANQIANQGNITFSGLAQFADWSFTQQSHFQLAVHAQRLDAAQMAQIASIPTAVSGTLNVEVQAHGSLLNPLGQGRIELSRAAVAGEPIQSVVVQFNGDGDAAHADLKLLMPAGEVSAVLTCNPRQRSYQASVQAHNFKLDQLQALKARNISVAGVANLDANGSGTLDDPQLTATLSIPQLRLGTQLSVNGQTADHIALQANVAQHVATLALDMRAVNSQLAGHATVQLSGDYQAEAALDTLPIQLGPLLAVYAPSQSGGVGGQTELHATLRGPLRHRERIEAHLTIPALTLDYQQSIKLALTSPIHADYSDGVLSVQHSGLKGTGTDLQFEGSLPLLDRARPMTLLLQGSVDLRLAKLIDPDVTSSGELRFNINSNGAIDDPTLQGQVQIVNANLSVSGAPLAMSNGNGTLALASDRLNINDFSATMGGGKVTARGALLFRPTPHFDLALSAREVRMLYPEGVRQGLSAELTLTGSPEDARLNGLINVDQLSFAPDFDLSHLVALSGGAQEPPSRGFAANLQLNLTVRSSQNVNLVSRTMSASGAANLRVTGSAAEPVILGRINLTSGDLIFQGNRYILQSAVLAFVNPSRTEPNLNASVSTSILQYNVGIHFEGPLDRLRTSYSSVPALPPADIINLIVRGQTQEAANAASAAGTTNTQTAEQSIASAVSNQVTSRAQKLAGISYLSVDPTLGTAQQGAGATITVQQRITSKFFVTYSADTTGTQRQVIQLQYQATPAVSVSGTRDQNGGFGLDTRVTHEW